MGVRPMSESAEADDAQGPETTEYEVPEGAAYDEYPITEIGYAHGFEHVYVVYEDDNLRDGWDQLIFGAEGSDERDRPLVTEPAVGVMPPEAAAEGDSPGAQTARALYRTLTECGIEVAGWESQGADTPSDPPAATE